jgi:hypothetical protein
MWVTMVDMKFCYNFAYNFDFYTYLRLYFENLYLEILFFDTKNWEC